MKILVVLTSHDQLGSTGKKTGFWLEEFAAPYYVFKDAGASLTLASPKGGQPPLDPKSDEEDAQTPATRRFRQDSEAQAALANTVKLSEVKADDYDAVFYPGGHGPLWDLAEDRTSVALIEAFHSSGKTVSAVCHAPAVFRHPRGQDGPAPGAGPARHRLLQQRRGRRRPHRRGAVPRPGHAQGQRRPLQQGPGLAEPRRGRPRPDHRAEPRVL